MTSRPDRTSATASGSPRPGLRGDIQGLRAIAVLTVVAGHAGLTWLPGGFVGVDVFFVISGFLISQLLYREVERSGRVSLAEFYARRARRILPAATVVVLATLAGALVWASALDTIEATKDAVWATFFAANIRFAAVGTDYFAADQGPSPLQHYWSLSVEEQFYLVWPLLLLLVVVLARRRATARRDAGARRREALPRLTLFWVLAAVTAASFAYGVLHTQADPTASYFSTPARAWELGLGAITALVATAVAGRLGAPARGALALVGLTLIGYACVAFDETTAFPGVAALAPVLGSALVLLAGAGRHEREPWPIRMLGVRPMQWVGDLSYSLYLWHWPLLILPTMTGATLSPVESAGLVALAFVLSMLTYRYVETPLREARRLPRPRALALYPVTIALVVAGAIGARQLAEAALIGDGTTITVADARAEPDVRLSKNDTIALVQASVIAARAGHEVPSTLRPPLIGIGDDVPDVGACDYTDGTVRELCPRGDTDADRTLVVLGNSHGRMWIPAFERIAQAVGYRTYYFVKPNCTAASLVVSDVEPATRNEPWTDCLDWREWAFEQIEALQPDLAVVSTSGPNPGIFLPDGARLGQSDPGRVEATEAGFVTTFERLEQAADRVVLIRDVPKAEVAAPDCLASGKGLRECMFTPMPEQEVDSDASQRAAEEAGVDVVDPRPWLCFEDQCPAVIGDVLPYRDRGHISALYAGELADELGRKMGIWDGGR
ncbi:acyltransferase family protein [Nocardioides sp.]|uniref:acyltransferase family protein n=1 Tax=Nocardioides sp. TaxID=35761 RepID=UPI00351385BC